MKNKLPEGWEWKELLSIIDYQGGSQPPKKEFIYEPKDDYVRLLQIRDFGNKPFPTYVPDSHKLKKANKGDILLARYGGASSSKDSLGRVCEGLEGAYNVALAKLIFSDKKLHRDYVKFLFLGPWFLNEISKNSRSCQSGFNKDDLKGIKFPIAPLSEQKRIADKLDKLLVKVKDVQTRLDKLPLILKRFRQSIIRMGCSGVLINSEQEYPMVNFGKLIKKIRGGTTAVPIREVTKFPVLRSSSVRQSFIDYEDVKYLTAEQSKNPDNFISNGDLLFTRLNGTAEYVGNCAVVFGIKEKTYQYPDRLYCAQVLDDILPEYCELAFSHPEIRLEIENRAKSSAGHKRISITDVKDVMLPLPSVAEQQQIVGKVRFYFTQIDKIKKRYSNMKLFTDKLEQSILAKAFRGELVLQD